MTEMRDLLASVAPWDDTGFATGAEVRAIAQARTRRTYAVAALVAAIVVAVAVPIGLGVQASPVPPAEPSPSVSASPTAAPPASPLVGRVWWVDLEANGIDVPGRGAPPATALWFAPSGRLWVQVSHGGGRLQQAGDWAATRDATGTSGALTLDLYGTPESLDKNPSCSRESCPTGQVAYWQGVEAVARAVRVAAFEIVPTGDLGEGAPRDAGATLRLTDDEGALLLSLVELTDAEGPQGPGTGDVGQGVPLAGTSWVVDLRANGITDDPAIAPTAPGSTPRLNLVTRFLLGSDGRLRFGNSYLNDATEEVGTWSAGGTTFINGGGILAVDLFFSSASWLENASCTRDGCPDGGLAYWPGTEALERFARGRSYEIVPTTDPPWWLEQPGPTLRVLGSQGEEELRLIQVPDDPAAGP